MHTTLNMQAGRKLWKKLIPKLKMRGDYFMVVLVKWSSRYVTKGLTGAIRKCTVSYILMHVCKLTQLCSGSNVIW